MKGNTEMKAMRIDKFLSQMQIATRSESKKMLKAGRVRLNGTVVTDGAAKCDPKSDEICVDEKPVSYREYRYVMLHKPAGCVTATEDLKDKTVMDYLPKEFRQNMFPVGRLDKDTEGLLLITDDGALNHNLLSPAKHVEKTYYAKIRGAVTQREIKAFAEGLSIGEKKPTAPAVLQVVDVSDMKLKNEANPADSETVSEIFVTITEGKFHQVKRMFQAVGMEVLYLKRVSMGSLMLDEELSPGEWRELTAEEIQRLKECNG